MEKNKMAGIYLLSSFPTKNPLKREELAKFVSSKTIKTQIQKIYLSPHAVVQEAYNTFIRIV